MITNTNYTPTGKRISDLNDYEFLELMKKGILEGIEEQLGHIADKVTRQEAIEILGVKDTWFSTLISQVPFKQYGKGKDARFSKKQIQAYKNKGK